MKNYVLVSSLLLSAMFGFAQDTATSKLGDTLMLQTIEVTSLRAADRAPFSKTNLSKEEIQQNNTGRDLPFILNQTPSVVAGSDAGNGVGYTNIRIRGSDATRINVTINGIPFNDAESQGTFFVNIPDIASSATSIQIQRGVGTSSNGSGSFGATINLSTTELNNEKYVQLENSYGSFNTWRNSLKAGTGLLFKHFTLDARVSNITSDGYIDRASTDLKSYFATAAWLSKKTSVRFNLISGNEKTYQAWNGVPEDSLLSNRTYNSAGTEKSGEPYANETDNYRQTHYQLLLNQQIMPSVSFNAGLFLVRGKGYYENYKARQKFSKYGLPDVVQDGTTITRTDMILQRWLDNYFYGTIFSAQYARGRTHLTFGGGYSLYDGDHFNKVKWAQIGISPGYSSYLLPAYKKDLNFYTKWMQSLGNGFYSFIDLQQRFVDYEINGFKDNPGLYVHNRYSFFNPKAGVSYAMNRISAFASLSLAAKEPNRKDFEAGILQTPRPEKLRDWEAGFSYTAARYRVAANFYYMDYVDQLVNTGKINDVGAFTRTNVPSSYRRGIELDGAYIPVSWLEVAANIAFSSNKIKEFTEYIYDEDGEVTESHFQNTDISFSPRVVAGGHIKFIPVTGAALEVISKYVSSQFLDNTSDRSRMLDSYFVQDLRMSYSLPGKPVKDLRVTLQINNIFNRMYESNGHTYNYIYEGRLYVENFYFPMAGTNFMAGIAIGL